MTSPEPSRTLRVPPVQTAAVAQVLNAESVRVPVRVASTPAPRVQSADLLRGQASVNIVHDGAIYTLRTTRSGGLILNK